jgi:hypothetical protein
LKEGLELRGRRQPQLDVPPLHRVMSVEEQRQVVLSEDLIPPTDERREFLFQAVLVGDRESPGGDESVARRAWIEAPELLPL